MPERTGGEATDREDGSAGLNSPRAGAGRMGRRLLVLDAEVSWGEEVRRVRLQADTATSPPKVTDVFGQSETDASAWSTILFGSKRTDPSLTGTTCTISTNKNPTPDSKILNLFRSWCTSESTEAANSGTVSGSSLVEGAAVFSLSTTTSIDAQTALLLGASAAQSPRSLRVTSVGETVTKGAKNTHPSVKPVELMRYLCRLICPPSGLILDPFCGSGTTGIAALAEGFSFVGVERDLDDKTGEPLGYCEIIKARLTQALIDHPKKETP